MKIFVMGAAAPTAVDLDGDDIVGDHVQLEDDESLWLEDDDDALPSGITAGQLRSPRLHRGRGKVEVAISYNGDTKSHDFGPGTTIAKVKRWAVSPDGFGVDPSDAGDLVLRLTGSTAELDEGEHVGTLAGPDRHLALDLVIGERIAG